LYLNICLTAGGVFGGPTEMDDDVMLATFIASTVGVILVEGLVRKLHIDCAIIHQEHLLCNSS